MKGKIVEMDKPMSNVQIEVADNQPSAGIRPMTTADVEAVAGLFRKRFPPRRSIAPDGLIRAIGDLYLPRAEISKEVASLVSYTEDGVLNGFIGAHPMPFLVDGKAYMAALCGGHMVDQTRADKLVGPRLLRTLLKGQQDLSISDTANAISDAMWRRMKAEVLPDYSLEWVRVFRPASFLAQVVGRRWPRALRSFGHPWVTRPFDKIGKKFLPFLGEVEPSHCAERDIPDDEEFADVLRQFTSHFSACPNWSRMPLSEMVARARLKPDFGDLSRRLVTHAGKPIGVYHLHAKPKGIGRVLQITSAPGAERRVIDRIFKTAREWELAGVQGRTQPALLSAMMARRCVFSNMSSTAVHARDANLLVPFQRGDAFLNGFAGEGWTPFFGGGI